MSTGNSNQGRRPFTVILTGGIASGKTTVSELFEKLGVPVIDTDVIARQVVTPGRPALERIVHEFGTEFLRPDGCLDRKKMRELIFSSAESRKKLEGIIHPAVRSQVLLQVEKVDQPYCIIVIPLYFESSGFFHADRVLVVDVREETQISRLMDRDSTTLSTARSILHSQASRKQRLALADDVLENEASPTELNVKVRKLHESYLSQAAGQSG